MDHTSPFPASFDGSALLFGLALWAMILISSLCTMLVGIQARQLYFDRRYGKDAAWAFNSLVLAVALLGVMRAGPEAVYMIAFAEASPATISTIMTTKRILDFLSLAPFIFWTSAFIAYRVEIILSLRSYRNRVYNDNRLIAIKRFLSVVFLTAAFAATVAIGRHFA